jgi:NTE family protein
VRLREWLASAPFTLTLSSGFFGFFAHAGLIASLLDAGLRPRAASGSSAGSLAAASLAVGLDGDTMKRELFALKKEHFWDPAFGFGLLRGKLFHDRLVDILGARDLSSLAMPVSISVFDILRARTLVVSDGPLAAAVVASCAVPIMFHPVRVKERWCVDGGVLDRPGLAGVPAGERVLFHHLTKAPRFKKGEVKTGDNRTTIAIDGLPRPLPDDLGKGPLAFDAARRAMEHALDEPVSPLMVRAA